MPETPPRRMAAHIETGNLCVLACIACITLLQSLEKGLAALCMVGQHREQSFDESYLVPVE